LAGVIISDIERDYLQREAYRSQGKLTSCVGYNAVGRKSWQLELAIPAERLSQIYKHFVADRSCVQLNSPTCEDYRLGNMQTFTYDCKTLLVHAETMFNNQVHSADMYRYDSLARWIGKTSEINSETEHKHFLLNGLRMLREENPGQSNPYLRAWKLRPASTGPPTRM
jgi:hypothetical protein